MREVTWQSLGQDASRPGTLLGVGLHTQGHNYVVAPDMPRPLGKTFGNVEVEILSLDDLMLTLRKSTAQVEVVE